MKLICDLIVNNLQFAGQLPRSRARKSQINVGKTNENQIFVTVQNANNKQGTKYTISSNISKSFERFIHEGKWTLQLKNPPVEFVLTKCDPLQLRLFLKTLKTGLFSGTADDKSKKLLECLPESHKKLKRSELAKNQSELTITTRKELLTTSFSRLLVKLELVGLDLSQIPPSVCQLSRLQSLNLSANRLKSLPMKLTFQLRELNLAGNQLGQAAHHTWSFFSLPQVQNTLQYLDLSGNQLPYVPMDICNLKNLVKLALKGNCIHFFPPCFHKLSRLRFLDISDNKVEAIDTTFQRLRLDTLDISGNVNAVHGEAKFKPHPRTVPPLLQTAAIAVASYKLDQRCLPQILQEIIQSLRRCWCMKPVWHTERSKVYLVLSKISQNVISDSATNTFPMVVYFCNKPCNQLLF